MFHLSFHQTYPSHQRTDRQAVGKEREQYNVNHRHTINAIRKG